MKCVQFFDVSVSVDSTGSITTDMFVKPMDMHQYLLATSCHPSHAKWSMAYDQAPRILRICSIIEASRLHCSEFVDCLVKRGCYKRKTNMQIERALANFATLQWYVKVIPLGLCTLVCTFNLVFAEAYPFTASICHYDNCCT